MKCKIYCYEHGKICDLVFEVKGIGVLSVEHYPIDEEFIPMNWESLKEYESSHSVKFIRTYIGEV